MMNNNVPHCKIIEDMLDEVSKQTRYRFAHRLICRGKYSYEEIAEIVDNSLDEVIEISKQLAAYDQL